MAHLGRQFPVYNPGRCICGDPVLWPTYLPTEFKWQVDDWYGTVGLGAPNGGRGLVPVSDPYDASQVVYSVRLQGLLSTPFFLTLTFTWSNAQHNLDVVMQVIAHGAPQLVTTDSYLGFYACYANWSNVGGATVGPFKYGYPSTPVAYPGNFLIINPRVWTDAAPPPPRSAPF